MDTLLLLSKVSSSMHVGDLVDEGTRYLWLALTVVTVA